MNRLSFLARTSLLIAFFFFIDKILAFVRVGIISRRYADSVELLDTFNAANNLPDVLFALISGGALAMAFIPLMSEYLTTRGRAARPSAPSAGRWSWPARARRIRCDDAS